MKPAVSIIIPHYRDVETTMGTLDSLYSTIDVDNFEVILVSDGSGKNYELPHSAIRPNMQYLKLPFNLGVGAAFDAGAGVASADTLILMGADIRFLDNGWASRMIRVIDKHPKALVCTECGSTESDRVHFGADIIFFVEQKHLGKHHPRKNIKEYRSVLEGKWRPRTGRGVYRVPSLMGAFYGVRRDWYEKLRGFELHYKWGVLEPYISLKSWRLGGEVLVDTDNKTLHMFNRHPQRSADWSAIAYNQQIIAGCVFGVYGIKYAQFLAEGETAAFDQACTMRMERIEEVNQMTHYLDENAKVSPEELERSMVELSYFYNQPGCKYDNPIKK